MRLSCNGCRVLRKGCSEHCIIRPCLQWIRTPEAQANATVFLAKFYGRTGLLNLIKDGPDHLRPAVFWSLLYEACGRIVNPVYGSVGLLWTGNWQFCQAAVEAVLRGDPIAQIPSGSPAASASVLPLKSCDIRHVAKAELRKLTKSRTCFKPKPRHEPKLARLCELSCTQRTPRHADGREEESRFSVETGEASHVSQDESDSLAEEVEAGGLELNLGLEPVPHCGRRGSVSR